MSDLVREPSDDEFSRLMDERAPGRLSDNAPPTELDDSVVDPPEPTELDSPEYEGEPEEVVAELPEKYQGKSTAELARMHQELEQRFGSQGNELGQLRALAGEIETVKAQMAAQQNQQPTPPAPWETPAFDGLDEAVLQNPIGTLKYVEEHSPHLYDRALETWASLDPFQASRYDTDKRIRDIETRHQNELAQVRQPVMESQQNALIEQAYVQVVSTNPLLDQVAEHIPTVLEENPEFKVLLQNGDLATKVRVLNNLATIASTRLGVAPTQTSAADAAAAAKVAATVASGSAGADRPASGQTSRSDWKKQFVAPEGSSIADELARNRAAAAKAGLR